MESTSTHWVFIQFLFSRCTTVQRSIGVQSKQDPVNSRRGTGSRPEDYIVMLLQSVWDCITKVALEWDKEKICGAAFSEMIHIPKT